MINDNDDDNDDNDDDDNDGITNYLELKLLFRDVDINRGSNDTQAHAADNSLLHDLLHLVLLCLHSPHQFRQLIVLINHFLLQFSDGASHTIDLLGLVLIGLLASLQETLQFLDPRLQAFHGLVGVV